MTTKLEAAARQALEALLAATPVKAKDPQLQADAIVALREALAEQQAAEPVEHCEAGPEYCPQCLSESKPTYGSEEVRKLKEVIESQAKIIALMEKERVCPPFWPVVQHLLDEYGLQLIDIVAAYKQATEQPAQEPVAWLKQLQKDAGAARGGQARAHAMGGIPMPSLSNGRGVKSMKAPKR